MCLKPRLYGISEGSVSHINCVSPVSSTANLKLNNKVHNFWTTHPPTFPGAYISRHVCHFLWPFLTSKKLAPARSSLAVMAESNEEVLRAIRKMSDKFDTLRAEVDELEEREWSSRKASEIGSCRSWSRSSHRAQSTSYRRLRSRSHHRLRSRSRCHRSHSSSPRRRLSAGQRNLRSSLNCTASTSQRRWELAWPSNRMEEDANHSEEEDSAGGLTDVLEQTHEILTTSCTRSMNNQVRKRIQGKYSLPRVEATKTPTIDTFMRSEISVSAKSLDKDLAKV